MRLITRGGYDWSDRYPLIAAAAAALAVPSCLIDGEAIACDAKGSRTSSCCAVAGMTMP